MNALLISFKDPHESTRKNGTKGSGKKHSSYIHFREYLFIKFIP